MLRPLVQRHQAIHDLHRIECGPLADLIAAHPQQHSASIAGIDTHTPDKDIIPPADRSGSQRAIP
jgi:hypothetical protein